MIYKEEKTQDEGEILFRIPRNIRQIGIVNESCRIYMEDYVYTFLGRIAKKQEEREGQDPCLAVFVGEIKWTEKTVYIFITGAVLAKEMELSEEHIVFQEKHWQKLQQEMEKYFPGQEITGWYFSQSGLPAEAPELFVKTHLKYFGGEKVLMLLNPLEHEEAFYRFENNRLIKQNGYYIFYERNEQMQAYMMDSGLFPPEEEIEKTRDEAVKSFRKRIREKKKDVPEETEENTSVFSYAAAACLVIAVVAVGASLYRNYSEMKNLDSQVQKASTVQVEQESAEAGEQMLTVTPRPTAILTPTGLPEKEEGEGAISQNTAADQTAAQDMVSQDAAVQDATDSLSSAQNTDSETGNEQGTESGDVYKEESDIRKAWRREALEAKETAAGTSYVVRPGDTLYEICVENYGNTDKITEICQLNNISEEEMIYPGQIILLP